MTASTLPLTAAEIKAHLQQGDITAQEAVTATLERIQTHNDRLNCFTTILSESALETAADIDRRRLAGESLGPLAGVPFAVKNLFDIAGTVTLPEAARARAAAYLITASEGSQLHLSRLQHQLDEFDPATRDRFLAGALIPSSWYIQAQRFRRWYRDQVRQIFQTVDLILAPTTPCPAPFIEQTTMDLEGETVLVRPHLGFYTQPLSFIGLPVLSVPVHLPGELPVGVQLIARPYDEQNLFTAAIALERVGITQAPLAKTFEAT